MSNRELEQRIYRLEETVVTLANWLVSAQSGLGVHDAHDILQLIEESRIKYDNDSLMAMQDEED